MSMTVVELLQAHKAISESLDESVEGQNDFRFAALGAVTEIVEALQCLPWRPWRADDDRSPTWYELNATVPELADAVGAILRMVVNLGISAEHFAAACEEHVRVKHDRISRGIDR